jgi:hypothetical protein
VSAIKSTMDAMSAAGRLMSGLAAAGRAMVDEVAGATPKPETRPEPPPGGPESA